MNILKTRNLAPIFLLLGTILGIWFLWFGHYFEGNIYSPDFKKAKEIQPFVAGLVVPLLTLGSALLVYDNLKNSAKQNFSSNFFKLIEMHHKLRDNISEKINGISDPDLSKGKDVFDDLCFRIYCDYYEISEDDNKDDKMVDSKQCKFDAKAVEHVKDKVGRNRLCALYDYYFYIHHSSLGHYFRNLYYLVKYADKAPFSKSFKEDHVRILRAQLSNYELLLLAYNCLHEYGGKFYPLVEKYELLKSLNNESKLPENFHKRIIDIDVLKNSYPHLMKYLSIVRDNKTVGDLTYFLKNVKVAGKTFTIFSYSNEI